MYHKLMQKDCPIVCKLKYLETDWKKMQLHKYLVVWEFGKRATKPNEITKEEAEDIAPACITCRVNGPPQFVRSVHGLLQGSDPSRWRRIYKRGQFTASPRV